MAATVTGRGRARHRGARDSRHRRVSLRPWPGRPRSGRRGPSMVAAIEAGSEQRACHTPATRPSSGAVPAGTACPLRGTTPTYGNRVGLPLLLESSLARTSSAAMHNLARTHSATDRPSRPVQLQDLAGRILGRRRTARVKLRPTSQQGGPRSPRFAPVLVRATRTPGSPPIEAVHFMTTVPRPATRACHSVPSGLGLRAYREEHGRVGNR